MTNTISVTAVDNDLIILAYQTTGSYQLCEIQSGYHNTVTVTININAWEYLGPNTLNGVSNPLNETLNLNLPSGSYYLQLLCIDWGTVGQFSINVNGTAYNYNSTTTPGTGGLVYYPSPISIQV